MHTLEPADIGGEATEQTTVETRDAMPERVASEDVDTDERASSELLSARERLRGRLLHDILHSAISPLPTEERPLNESAIMERYDQNSRMPVRMALAVLAGEGLFRQRARYGYWLVDYNLDDVEQILRMRAGIEGMIAAALCEREIASGGTESAPVAPLRFEAWCKALAVHEEMGGLVSQADGAELDREFEASVADLDTQMHVLLARAGGYDMAARHIVEWRNQMRIFALQSGLFYYSHALPTIHEEHARVVDAIKSADGSLAAALARTHIENTLTLSQLLAETQVGPG
jgi:DNA-binding GntR family transcriptional regulator